MKLINIILLITFFMIPLVNGGLDKIYFIDLEYSNGSLSLLNTSLLTGYPILSNEINKYKTDLFSIKGELLYKGYFDIPNELFFDNFDNLSNIEGGFITLDSVNFSISLPYYTNGDIIKLSKDGKKLLSIDVSQFAIYCGDGKCSSNDKYQDCLQDCQIKPKEKEILIWSIILKVLITISIIMILVILMLILKKKSQNR